MVKKQLLLAFFAFFVLTLPALANVLTEIEETNNETNKVVQEYKEDVTGDGKQDTIVLEGVPYDKDSPYLKEIFLIVETDANKKFKVTLEGGYEPEAEFQDLNHDGVKDVFISVATGGSGGIYNYYLYSFKDNKQVDVGVPEPLTIQGEFQDDYKAIVSIPETQESYTVDLSGRKDEYDRLGLYVDGKLNEPTELMVDPYSFMKPENFGNVGYGLKAIQAISGAYHADGIGRVESKWYYKDNKWTLVDARFIPFE
ncbi:hypothetical protein GCM10008967_01830 [Bacillus carboniphilus]|uniref:Spore coat protein n=1 Tax=Bacillus carboniphilus TaxID=86663 RepID=A0ABN0VRG8_9BACI